MTALLEPQVEQWHGCYETGWGNLITPESFAHPAKYSRDLIERIFDHCLERGYIAKGGSVGDPFGGIGTGGITAAYRGLEWIGCELEPRFVEMAENNFALHAHQWRVLGSPNPRIIQGDSRAFHVLLGGDYDAVVSSPPYAVISTGAGGLNTKPAKHAGQQSGRKASSASQDTDQRYGITTGQIGRLKSGSVAGVISSPPFADSGAFGPSKGVQAAQLANGKWKPDGSQFEDNYGSTSGQIGRLKAGQVSAVVSSPPYADSIERPSGIDPDKVKKPGGPNGQTFHRPCGVDGVVSSPPYAGISPEAHGAGIDLGKHYRTYRSQGGGCSFEKFKASRARHQENYGSANGQIGKEKGESYWQAMDAVYRSCYQAIRPGGVIVLVLKDYVSKRKRVPLCDDTAKLLEHIGYTPLERIQAMLVKETRHGDLFQGETVHKKERKSFFRRLHEKKPGAVKIDFEEVLFYRRP